MAAGLLSLRSKLLGLNAAHQRFDALQTRTDLLQEYAAQAEERLAAMAASVAAVAGGVEALRAELAPVREKMLGMPGLQQAVARVERRVQALGSRAAGGVPPDAGFPAAQLPSFRLAFLLHTEELVNHFGSVWDRLPPGSFDVILHEAAKECAPALFERWGCTLVSSDEVLASGLRYDYLVSNHPVSLGEQPLVRRLAEHQVRFMYAAGKTGWNLSEWNSLYDVILCFGPHHAAKFAQATSAVVVEMGYPRFDRFFASAPDRAALARRYGCDPARRTVVWLPTWKALSSVGHYDEEISALTNDYNVVVKLHPLMVQEEPGRVESLRRHPFTCLITDASDNLPLYQLADCMLFDYGGPPLAGVYTDRDMLLLDVPGAASDPMVGADSPDLAIREHLTTVEPGANRIAALLAEPATWQRQCEARRMLRRRYFAPYYGFSADVAASALLRLPLLLGAEA